nr:MAG TPA: hypothetical protein [Caudoviricetes sp.]
MPIDIRFFACFKIFKKVLKKVLTLFVIVGTI